MQAIQIGNAIKPRGLRGEIKCTLFPARVDSVFIDGANFKIVKQTDYDGHTYLFLDGVATVDAAERFRGKKIEIDRADLKLGPDMILTSDLVGFSVADVAGKIVGTVKSVDDFGAGEIINLGAISFPYVDEFVVETNMETRTLVVRPAAIIAAE